MTSSRWVVRSTDHFDAWLAKQEDKDRENILSLLLVLEDKGPFLKRPYVDSVYGSKHSNLKELRIQSKGTPIRVFFAFTPHREAILLCAGKKSGNERYFYQKMLRIADNELSRELKT